MGTHRLICHPDTPSLAVLGINVTLVEDDNDRLLLRWRVDGGSALSLPAYSGSGRAEELWTTTCFEMFVQGDDRAYVEYNFSPSQRWAAYRFPTYRDGRSDEGLSDSPVIDHQQGDRFFVMTVKLPRPVDENLRIGLSAVIEEEGGVKSYWALAHPDGEPDFHDPACFIAALPAPVRS